MKSYKAVVIDGKKIIKRGVQLVLIITVAGLLMLNLKLSETAWPKNIISAERSVEESFPVMRGIDSTKPGVSAEILESCKKLFSFVMNFDVFKPQTVVVSEVPFIKTVSQGYLARTANDKVQLAYNPKNADNDVEHDTETETPEQELFPIKEVDSGQAKALGDSKGKILIRNDTEFGINIEQMLAESLKFDMTGEGPKVLIVHTHATESYSPQGVETYDSNKSDRSLDCDENMVKVGEEIKKVFEENGISVIHDKTLHDHPNFNGSYENSRKTVEKHLKEHPGIVIVLDIHRDAFVYEDGTKAKFVTEIDGQKTAQLMFVIGTNAGGLEHPNWRENMKLALKFQSRICEKYPNLMRGVNLRKERFNGHTTYGSMIIEVGSSGNTIEEAIRGARYGATEIAKFLKSL